MKKLNENDILETTLSIAEKGYPEAYQFLLNAYEEIDEAALDLYAVQEETK